MRWLPWRERFYGNGISCTSSRQTCQCARAELRFTLKIESQLSIDKELASIERMKYTAVIAFWHLEHAHRQRIYTRSKVLRSPCEGWVRTL